MYDTDDITIQGYWACSQELLFPKYVSTSLDMGMVHMLYNDIGYCKNAFAKLVFELVIYLVS